MSGGEMRGQFEDMLGRLGTAIAAATLEWKARGEIDRTTDQAQAVRDVRDEMLAFVGGLIRRLEELERRP